MRELDRSLGLVAVVAIAISAMLGSGIFVLPGLAVVESGSLVWLAYLLAGLSVVPAALCKSELATAMPSSGGSYVYLDRTFGPLFGTIAGVALWASMLLKSAFALLGFGAYLEVLVALPAGASGEQWLRSFALGMLVLITLLNVVGVKKVGRAQTAVVGVALVGLLAIVAFSEPHVVGHRLLAESHGLGGLLAAAGLVYVSYDGVTKVAAIAEEIKQPSRNLPLGILLSLGLVLLIYTSVAAVLVGVLPIDSLRGDLKPIHSIAELVGGHWAGLGAAALGVLTMTSMANAGLLAASRYPFAMARDQLLPARMAKLSNRYRTPTIAVVATSAVMAITIELLDIERVAKVASAVVMLVLLAETVAVVMFRETRAGWYRPTFRAPLYPWLHGVGIVSCLALLAMLGVISLIAAAAVALPGAALFLLYGRRRTARLGVVRKIAPRGDLAAASTPGRDGEAAARASHAAVVVALFGRERTPEMLVEVAAALADDKRIYAMHLSEVDETADSAVELDEGASVKSLRRRFAAMAEQLDLELEFHALVSRDLGRTVHAAAARAHCHWLVMRWHDRPRQSLTSLSPIGWLVNHLPANLVMYRDAGVRYVRRILALPAPGPHDALVVRTADELAATWTAQLVLGRFVPEAASEVTVAAAHDYLGQLRRLCHSEASDHVVQGSDAVRSLAAASASYDLIVMAAPRLTVRNLLRPSSEHRITAAAACNVLTLRTAPASAHEALSRAPRSRADDEPTRLIDCLAPGMLGASITVADKAQLLAHLAARFATAGDLEDKAVADAFSAREREESTGVGRGVALPHATIGATSLSLAGVFTLAEPIEFQAADGQAVDVVFATLCPPSAREAHLRLLSRIARLTMTTNLLERLRTATNAEQMRSAIEHCAAELED